MLRNRVSKRSLSLIYLGLLLSLAVLAITLRPKAALADEGSRIKGTFTVAASVTSNTGGVTYCGGNALALAVEAHGAGYSNLGALSLSLQKTINAPGAMHGCLTLTAPNGDVLNAIYDGTEGTQNANRFRDGSGTLTFTGGTGRFQDASGSAQFTAVFSAIYPASSFLGGTTAPLQVEAFYSVEGSLFLPEE